MREGRRFSSLLGRGGERRGIIGGPASGERLGKWKDTSSPKVSESQEGESRVGGKVEE